MAKYMLQRTVDSRHVTTVTIETILHITINIRVSNHVRTRSTDKVHAQLAINKDVGKGVLLPCSLVGSVRWKVEMLHAGNLVSGVQEASI